MIGKENARGKIFARSESDDHLTISKLFSLSEWKAILKFDQIKKQKLKYCFKSKCLIKSMKRKNHINSNLCCSYFSPILSESMAFFSYFMRNKETIKIFCGRLNFLFQSINEWGEKEQVAAVSLPLPPITAWFPTPLFHFRNTLPGRIDIRSWAKGLK